MYWNTFPIGARVKCGNHVALREAVYRFLRIILLFTTVEQSGLDAFGGVVLSYTEGMCVR